MKILYVYDNMPGVYQNYLNGLLKAIKEKLPVKTLVYAASKTSDYVAGSNRLKDKLQRLYYKLGLTKMPTLDLKYMLQYDVVHLQHSYLWKKMLPFIDLKEQQKLVITLRGGDTYLKPWSYRTLANFYESGSEKVDAFVVMSQHQKEYLMRWGVLADRIHIIPISFGGKSKASPKKPKPDKLHLVSAFRMTWEKNIEGHIQFAAELKARGINFSYDIYGNGSNLDQLYFLVDRYELQKNINIKGKIINTQLKTLLPNYDFFVQLSISESLGMSVIEAQSCGVPCIVSNSGGLPEAVIKNETAIVEDYRDIKMIVDSCLSLWNNESLYYSYSKNAITYANANFTVNQELEKLELLYTKLLDS